MDRYFLARLRTGLVFATGCVALLVVAGIFNQWLLGLAAFAALVYAGVRCHWVAERLRSNDDDLG